MGIGAGQASCSHSYARVRISRVSLRDEFVIIHPSFLGGRLARPSCRAIRVRHVNAAQIKSDLDDASVCRNCASGTDAQAHAAKKKGRGERLRGRAQTAVSVLNRASYGALSANHSSDVFLSPLDLLAFS